MSDLRERIRLMWAEWEAGVGKGTLSGKDDRYMCRGFGKEMDPAYEAVWSGGTARHWDVKAQAWCGPVVEEAQTEGDER